MHQFRNSVGKWNRMKLGNAKQLIKFIVRWAIELKKVWKSGKIIPIISVGINYEVRSFTSHPRFLKVDVWDKLRHHNLSI